MFVTVILIFLRVPLHIAFALSKPSMDRFLNDLTQTPRDDFVFLGMTPGPFGMVLLLPTHATQGACD